MDERYPIGVTESCAVTVLRHDGAEDGYGELVGGGRAAERRGDDSPARPLRGCPRRAARRARPSGSSPGARLARDEYLDVTASSTDGVETVALSSTARSPVRVTIEVPRDELDELAALLARAQELIETLRQGLGLVPDSLPEAL